MEIELQTDQGAKKRVSVIGICDGWAFIWWPGSGAYDLDLNNGRLVSPLGCTRCAPHQWRACEEDLTKLRQTQTGPL